MLPQEFFLWQHFIVCDLGGIQYNDYVNDKEKKTINNI